MRPTSAGVALSLLLAPLAAVVFATATPAGASTNCDAVVVDQAHVLNGGDQAQVEKAASKLADSIGAEVRVRTYAKIPTTTLDQFMPRVVNACPSWQDTAGGTKQNLLVYVVSMEPKRLGFYSGDEWTQALDANGDRDRIKATIMTPNFRDGDFATGFDQAMAETQSVLYAFQHPSTANNGGGGTVVNNNKPANLTGLWIVLGALIGGILLLVGLYFWWRWASARRRENEERETAQARARTAKQSVDQAINSLGSDRQTILKSKANTYGVDGDPDGEALKTQYATFTAKFQSASGAMGNLDTSAGDPDRPGQAAGVYNQLADHYDRILVDAAAAVQAADEVDRLADAVKAKLGQLTQMLADETTGIADVRATVAQMRTAGFSDSSLQNLEANLGTADEDIAAARAAGANVLALRLVSRASSLRKEAADAASTLVERREALLTGIDEVEANIAENTADVDSALDAFRRIKDGNPDNVWGSIKGNGTEATNRIGLAQTALDQLRTASDMQNQEWDKAEALLTEARHLLTEAASLLEAITALEARLIDARQRAPHEIDLAETDLATAQAYERDNDDDVDDTHKDELREAERLLGEAKNALDADKPNYLRVVDLAIQANSAADRILELAMSEVEAAERLRRQAATALQNARQAVDKAETYIGNHHSHVESDTKRMLEEAQRLLQAAQDTHNVSDRLSNANKARKKADSAYKSARDDVDRNTYVPPQNYGSGSSNNLALGIALGSLNNPGNSWGSPISTPSFGGGGGFGGSDGGFGGGGGRLGGSDSGF